MKTWVTDVVEIQVRVVGARVGPSPAVQPSSLYLVTPHELKDLRAALARGSLPPDFEAKLAKLAAGSLGHRFIAQQCRTMIALLQAVEDGAYRGASPAQCERLLRVLAYVRKDDDAIPDYRADGFTDDQLEVRQVANEFSPLFNDFKAWRLRHQVPGLWMVALTA